MKNSYKMIIFLSLVAIMLYISFNPSLGNTIRPNKETDVFQEKIESELSKLSLEEKIGQMLIVTYNTQELTPEIAEDLTTYKPCGVILFSDNIKSYKKTTKFIKDMQETATIPLFMALDQEGGKVARLTQLTDAPVSLIPSMANLGQTKDLKLAREVGKVIGEEINALGFNLDFAPVIDTIKDETSFIGTRSFGTDYNLVGQMGIALAQGLNDANIIATFKHFPGHGSTITDSHYDLPLLEKTKEELLTSDLIPFQMTIKNNAPMIMIGHLATPNITYNNTPASLSKEIITNLLRNDLGYDGIVITDALNMQALTNYYSEQEIYEMAINAGVDILLMPSSAETAIKLIKESIAEGNITLEQIDDSVSRILKLKYQKIKEPNWDKALLGSKNHQEILKQIP